MSPVGQWAGNRTRPAIPAGRAEAIGDRRIELELDRGQGGRRGQIGGLTGWLLARLSGKGRPRPQLAVLERITLAPRQSLALIEASGQRLLVATSADGTPAFYPVGGSGREAVVRSNGLNRTPRGRVSW
jgi:hypothetical protein